MAVNLAGGTHHAFADRGEGFCVFNDVAVAARALQAEGRRRAVAVLDCDVHQGNGTAAIFAGDATSSPSRSTAGATIPFHKETSDLDMELADGTGDDDFLDAPDTEWRRPGLRAHLAFYLAGADPYEGDRLGRLALTRPGSSVATPWCWTAAPGRRGRRRGGDGGGYAEVDDIVAIHLPTVRAARGWRLPAGPPAARPPNE